MATDFEWPWQYNFPPFFTVQINRETLKQQLSAWKQLVLDYLKANKQSILDVREAHQSPLFRNTKINRQLPIDGILLVMEELSKTGHAEPADKLKNRWYIYWEAVDELASAIYKWATSSGHLESVCTLFYLTNDDDTKGEVFYGLNNEVLIRVLKKLEATRKAELMSMDGSIIGVKFF